MFRPILGRLQVVSYSLKVRYPKEKLFVFRIPHSLGYTKQPEDGLK